MTFISSKTCPFAHRTEIVRLSAGLENKVNVTYLDPVFTLADSWRFNDVDTLEFPTNTLQDVYKRYQRERTKIFSVPVLINDDKFHTESLDICRLWLLSLFPDLKSLSDWISDF